MARCEDCLHYKVCLDIESQHLRIILAGDKAERCKRFMPTADVVPKSEYDAVVSAVDNSTNEFLRLHDEYQKLIEKNSKLQSQMAIYQLELHHSKKAVAREIFEEIGKYMDEDDGLSVYMTRTEFYELKEKYTGKEG